MSLHYWLPDQRLVLLLGRHGHDFELRDAGRTMAVAGAHAVAAGVSAADDDDVLAIGTDLMLQLRAWPPPRSGHGAAR